MRCYICDQTSTTFTLRYNVAVAMGICHNCGVGVCAEHSRKKVHPGSSLLCIHCASLRRDPPAVKPVENAAHV